MPVELRWFQLQFISADLGSTLVASSFVAIALKVANTCLASGAPLVPASTNFRFASAMFASSIDTIVPKFGNICPASGAQMASASIHFA